VAVFIHKAAPRRVDNITNINILELATASQEGVIIPHLIVFTTSQPAIMAHQASKMTAIIIAQANVSAFDPTAGPILFATSLAPIFIAI